MPSAASLSLSDLRDLHAALDYLINKAPLPPPEWQHFVMLENRLRQAIEGEERRPASE